MAVHLIKQLQIRKKRRYYRKSLSWLLFVASIPGLITGISLYLLATGSLESQLLSQHHNQIQKQAKTIDDQLSSLENSIGHWSFQPNFGQDLSGVDLSSEFQTAWDLSKSLVIVQGSHPLIRKVELYIDHTSQGPVVFSPGVFSVEEKSLQEAFNALMDRPQHVFWQHWDKVNANYSYEGMIFVHKAPGNSLSPYGALIVRIDEERLSSMLQGFTSLEGGISLLLNENNELISEASEGQNNEMEQWLVDKVASQPEQNGSFSMDWQGTSYSVSYGQMNRTHSDWRYISAAPMSAITSPVIKASNIILWISVAGFLVAIVLSLLASRRIYSPIERLVESVGKGFHQEDGDRDIDEFQLIEKRWENLTGESQSLQHRLEEHLPQVKEGFLYRLLHGQYDAYELNDLEEQMQTFGWEMGERTLQFFYVHLTGSYTEAQPFSDEDDTLILFAATNIVREFAEEIFEQSISLNVHNMSVGVLVFSSSQGSLKADIERFSAKITEAINQLLFRQVTLVVSSEIPNVKAISTAYSKTVETVSYRNIVEKNQVIYLENVQSNDEATDFVYPLALEKEIIQAMRTGQEGQVLSLVKRFMTIVSTQYQKEYIVQQYMLQLLGAMQQQIVSSSVLPHWLLQSKTIFERFMDVRGLDEMVSWVHAEVIVPYTTEMQKKTNDHHKKMSEDVVSYLQEHYTEDVSLDFCAEMIGTSPYTLSKAFKATMGVNFVEYVTDLRINHAKKMLQQTDRSIRFISNEVGYQQSYFNRIFKKVEGMTPGEYRKKKFHK
ncbi:AraC family transcriptional regulator [Aureibacillus halotolerans]|uniref:AraC family transcriptional regulator n=1 Tax=Aureibacillus halotolerans TaxID=1508390 RepID=A0A4R6U8F6_9BACI|nr:AraC family transcriptional regulator [Aureibacillus halotolerans]TDQ42860.1 AraC family transcriptional regulator [Aureibacillus halotolerans]